MPNTGFTVPSLSTLIERIADDINTNLDGADARLRRSVPGALGRMEAGVAKGLYGYVSYGVEQVIWDTAEEGYLRRWASMFGMNPLDAVKATGSAVFTGTPASSIPTGHPVARVDGVSYTVDAPGGTIGGGGSVTLPITADDVGADGNATDGTLLNLVTPLTGVDPTATVAASPNELEGGTDDETTDELRTRFLAERRKPKQGGATADYEAWTRETEGLSATIDEVYVTPLESGAGTVGVRFSLVVPDGGAPADCRPTTGDVSAVQTYVDSVRPVTALVTVTRPDTLAIPMTIAVTPDTAAIRTAVEAEIDAMLARERSPGGTVENSKWREAISAAAGEDSHTLDDLNSDGTGLSDVTAGANELLIRGTITWA